MGNKRERHLQKLTERAERIVTGIVNKTFAPKITSMSLPEQVNFAKRMMKWQGMPAFRSHFLKDGNFPRDIEEMRAAGKTSDQIWELYRDCPEFMEFWKSLEMDEDHLKVLIYGNNAAPEDDARA